MFLPCFPLGVQDSEVADGACGRATEAIELFARSATVLPRQPAVLLLSASPNQNYCAAGRYELIRALSRVSGASAGMCRHQCWTSNLSRERAALRAPCCCVPCSDAICPGALVTSAGFDFCRPPFSRCGSRCGC